MPQLIGIGAQKRIMLVTLRGKEGLTVASSTKDAHDLGGVDGRKLDGAVQSFLRLVCSACSSFCQAISTDNCCRKALCCAEIAIPVIALNTNQAQGIVGVFSKITLPEDMLSTVYE